MSGPVSSNGNTGTTANSTLGGGGIASVDDILIIGQSAAVGVITGAPTVTVGGVSQTVTAIDSHTATGPETFGWWVHCANSGSISITFSNTAAANAYMFERWTGLTASPLDQHTQGRQAATTTRALGPTGATTQANEVVIAILGETSANTSPTFTATSPFTLDSQWTGNGGIWMAWNVVSSTGAQSFAGSSTRSEAYSGVLATFKTSSTAWTAAPTETVTATDTPGRAFTGTRNTPETATTSDTPNRVQVLLRLIAENSIVTDLGNRLGVFKRQDTETSTTADSGNRLVAYLAVALEAITASELVQRALALARPITEATTNSDNADRAQALTRESDEQSTTQDQPNRIQQLLRAVLETAQTLDSAAASVGHGATDWVVSAVESVITSDLVQRALTLGRNTQETIAETDTTARQTDLGRATQEATEAADATGRSVGALRSVDDTTTAQDASGRIHGVIAAVTEALSNSDTLNRAGSWLRDVAEATGVLDLVSALVHRNASPGSIDITLSQPYTVAVSLSQPFTVEASVTTVNTIDIAMSRG